MPALRQAFCREGRRYWAASLLPNYTVASSTPQRYGNYIMTEFNLTETNRINNMRREIIRAKHQLIKAAREVIRMTDDQAAAMLALREAIDRIDQVADISYLKRLLQEDANG